MISGNIRKPFLKLLPIQIAAVTAGSVNSLIDTLVTSRYIGPDAVAGIGFFSPMLTVTFLFYVVLLVLWERDGISVTEIGERLMLDNGTLSPLLKKLEQAGYVTRRRSREDERMVIICLTDNGRALQEKARDVPAHVADCIDLPAEKAQMLYMLLYELLDNRKRKTAEEDRK